MSFWQEDDRREVDHPLQEGEEEEEDVELQPELELEGVEVEEQQQQQQQQQPGSAMAHPLPLPKRARRAGPALSLQARQKAKYEAEQRAQREQEDERRRAHMRTHAPRPEKMQTLEGLFSPTMDPEFHLGVLLHIQDAHRAYQKQGPHVQHALSMGDDYEALLERFLVDAFDDMHQPGRPFGSGRDYWLLLILTYMHCHSPARASLRPEDAAFLERHFASHLGNWLMGRRTLDGAFYGTTPGTEPDTSKNHPVAFAADMRALYAHVCRPLLH